MSIRLRSLRVRLMLCTGLMVMLGLLVQGVSNFWIARRDALATMDKLSVALAHSHADTVTQWLEARHRVVRSMQAGANEAELMASLRQAEAAGGFDATYIGFPDKRHVFSKPQDLGADYDPTSRPWYQRAQQAQGSIVTDPYFDAGVNKLVMTFSVALREAQELKAVVAGDVFMDDVTSNVASIRPTPGTFAFIVSVDGRVMVHEQIDRVIKKLTDIVPELTPERMASLVGQEGLYHVSIQGRGRLLKIVPIKNTDWRLVIALDEAEAMAGVRRTAVASVMGGLLITLVVVGVLGATMAISLRPLDALREAMEGMGSGEGDLTRRLPAMRSEELGAIANGFNRFVDRLQEMMLQIRSSADSIGTASAEIAMGNQDLSVRTEQTAGNLQRTASSVEQLTATVRQSADSARQASQLASSASSVARDGGGVVAQVVTTMDDIQQSSRRIADIISVIDGIAFQTNILALNAAVEAARAGEQGRGFAVVAGEVRGLAQRCAQAAREIKELIGASVDKVAAGSALVQSAGGTMQELVQSVQRVSDIISEISTAASEQSLGIEQVNSAVGQLDQMTQQNAALVEQSAAAAQSLKEQADRLTDAVGVFRLR